MLKIIKIKTINDNKIKILQLFGKNVLYIEKHKNKKIDFYLNKKNTSTEDVFYLKIHTIQDNTLECFQKWIDVAGKKNAKVYIVCDDKKTESSLYKHIKFHSVFEIIKSKNKKLYPYMKAIGCKYWYNAVLAKLAIFYHAKQQGYKKFWKIDADDTMFCMGNDEIAKFLQNAEDIATRENISAFSLDMHTSKLYGKHWSFGVCYIDNTIDWFSIFSKYMNDGWKEKYQQKYSEPMNLDWFFTYLRDKKILNIKSFYINGSFFYHYKDKTSKFMTLSHWSNNKLIYPYLEIFNSYFKETPIFIDNICIGSVEKYNIEPSIKKEILNEGRLHNILANYNEIQILYPPQGLGDILFVCALIREYKKNNSNKNIAILVTKKHFYDFAKLYQNEFDNIILYDKPLYPNNNLININCLAYKHKTLYDIINKYKNFKNLFINVMNADEKCSLYYPEIEKVKDNSLSNSILIAPDSVSVPSSISDESWIFLANQLKQKGFDIIFNCNNKERFKNYDKAFWDIKTTIQKINNMKAFISYRSGLADVIGAFCRQIPQYIIYPEKYDIGNQQNEKDCIKKYFNFCSIKENLDNNLVNEYIYDKNSFLDIVEKIQ